MNQAIMIAHYATTGLVILWMVIAGLSIFARKPFIHTAITRLGYPSYFTFVLGTAKLIGAAFLLLPLPALFKTLAFGGAVIELLCATVSYYVIDNRFSEWIKPIVLLVIVLAAFVLWRLHSGLTLLA